MPHLPPCSDVTLKPHLPMRPSGSVYLLYHFFHPDDVVSARLFSDLAVELAAGGYDVTALPSIRSCHGPKVRLQQRQSWIGGQIHRVWRPSWPQHRSWGRFGNALCMLLMWTWRAAIMPRRRNETMIVGTDPVLSVLVAISWKLLRPRAKIIHWCHDLYPHAAVAESMLKADSLLVRTLHFWLRIAYRRCDVIADLGSCMRRLLIEASGETQTVRHLSLASESSWRDGRFATLVPWALVEPSRPAQPDPLVREQLFGEAALGLLYSGNFGRAHCFEAVLELARQLRDEDIGFCFAGRGLRLDELRAAVNAEETNIRFAGFADEDQLAARLAAADIHLVTLRENWTGTVVPSKFFGALAVGRPVLFAGSAGSAIAQWIEEFGVGWVLNEQTVPEVAAELRLFVADRRGQETLRQRCFDVYQREFSRQVQLGRWLEIISGQRSEISEVNEAAYAGQSADSAVRDVAITS